MVAERSIHPLGESVISREESILPPWAGQHRLVQVVTRLVNYKLRIRPASYLEGRDRLMLSMSSQVRMRQ